MYGTTGGQHCWLHNTASVLNKLLKSPQSKAALHQTWMAATRQGAEKAFDHLLTVYRPKYPKAVAYLETDREASLAFYDFPMEHGVHRRTTHSIAPTFAMVRLRTDKTRSCVSRGSILATVFLRVKSAERESRN